MVFLNISGRLSVWLGDKVFVGDFAIQNMDLSVFNSPQKHFVNTRTRLEIKYHDIFDHISRYSDETVGMREDCGEDF